MNPFQQWMLAIIGVSVLLIVAVLMGPERGPAPEDAAATRAAEAECMKGLECWGARHKAAASTYCLSAIGHRAEEIKWSDGTDPELRYHRWLDRKAGTLTYYDHALQMRSTVGDWVNYAFECDYDPKTDELLALRLEPNG